MTTRLDFASHVSLHALDAGFVLHQAGGFRGTTPVGYDDEAPCIQPRSRFDRVGKENAGVELGATGVIGGPFKHDRHTGYRLGQAAPPRSGHFVANDRLDQAYKTLLNITFGDTTTVITSLSLSPDEWTKIAHRLENDFARIIRAGSDVDELQHTRLLTAVTRAMPFMNDKYTPSLAKQFVSYLRRTGPTSTHALFLFGQAVRATPDTNLKDLLAGALGALTTPDGLQLPQTLARRIRTAGNSVNLDTYAELVVDKILTLRVPFSGSNTDRLNGLIDAAFAHCSQDTLDSLAIKMTAHWQSDTSDMARHPKGALGLFNILVHKLISVEKRRALCAQMV